MKIITKTERGGTLCYVQVKDLMFLAKYVDSAKLMYDYLDFINNGKCDEDFIKINGEGYIKAFMLCDYIIDFSDYSSKNIGVNYLSSLISTKACIMPRNPKDKKGICYQIDGIRDMISYKKGELEYKIPLVPNGKFEKIDLDKKIIFSSTVVEDCFTLSSISGEELNKVQYDDFLRNVVNDVFDKFYSSVNEDEREYQCYDRGNYLIINIHNNSKKKKKDFMGKILSKKRNCDK